MIFVTTATPFSFEELWTNYPFGDNTAPYRIIQWMQFTSWIFSGSYAVVLLLYKAIMLEMSFMVHYQSVNELILFCSQLLEADCISEVELVPEPIVPCMEKSATFSLESFAVTFETSHVFELIFRGFNEWYSEYFWPFQYTVVFKFVRPVQNKRSRMRYLCRRRKNSDTLPYLQELSNLILQKDNSSPFNVRVNNKVKLTSRYFHDLQTLWICMI